MPIWNKGQNFLQTSDEVVLLGKKSTNHQYEFDALRQKVLAAAHRITPTTMMSWGNGPPPVRWRLEIDDELMRLASRKRHPCIRSDLAILAEFPMLKWNGPYLAAKFFLYGYLVTGMVDPASIVRVIRSIQTDIDLLRDIQKSIQGYVDKTEGTDLTTLLYYQNTGDINYAALKKAIGNAEILEKEAQEVLGARKKGGRPPAHWKSTFVWWLAELWRIMTGHGASKDLSSPFASFVSAAWASLGSDLPEISWASQIHRIQKAGSAAELTDLANSLRMYALIDPPYHTQIMTKIASRDVM